MRRAGDGDGIGLVRERSNRLCEETNVGLGKINKFGTGLLPFLFLYLIQIINGPHNSQTK